jgi:hypothetical protein
MMSFFSCFDLTPAYFAFARLPSSETPFFSRSIVPSSSLPCI